MMVQDFEHRGVLGEVNRRLKRFLPRFERLSARVSGGTILLYLHEEGPGNPIPATRVSDGTLRFIALLLDLMASPPPTLVCIEEPELGLHPDALSLVAELLVEASERTQLIVTTHSDALVSALTDHLESVLVCEHRGGTELVRLESERLKHWLDKYRLGDLWRMGELGGNP
jgi:predicted ATPase